MSVKKIQTYSCPNQKCQRKFDSLVIVHDNSKIPRQVYYACPYCLLKLDPTTIQVLKKGEISVDEKIGSNMMVLPEREIPPGCLQYLGYLSVRTKDANISHECLVCPKVLDCALKSIS